MKAWRRYLRFWGRDIPADIEDELRFHLEMRIRDYEQRGMPRAEAEQAAHERLGDLHVIGNRLEAHDRTRARRAGWSDMMDRLRQDLALAFRGLCRTPTFFATAVVILAIGIGMSVAMFTVFRTVLVRKLPVADQDRVAVMWTYRDKPDVEFATGPKALAEVRRKARTIRDVAGVMHGGALTVAMLEGDRPVALNRSLVTGNFFDVLGARPVLGRLLHSTDDDAGPFDAAGTNASKMMVISYRAWQDKFGGDSSIIGRHLTEPLLGWRYTIVGVAPPGLSYPADVDFWIPIWGGWTSGASVFAVARLAPGATARAAADEYFSIENRELPQLHVRGATAKTFAETVLGDARPVLALLTAAVGLLLLIACLNVGNLLLLRASSRAREIAVRRALGAGYSDILRQLVAESILLAVAGGAAGWALAATLVRALIAFAPPQLPRLDEIRLSGAPVWISAAIATLSLLIFRVVPSLFAARASLATPLRFDSRAGSESRRRRIVRQTLVASQVALATIMLGGAGLLARSLARLERQDAGYDANHLSILTFTWSARTTDSGSKRLRLSDRLMRRVEAIPGVTAATPTVIPPLLGDGVWHWRFDKEGQTDAEAASNPTIPIETGGPDYFKTFGIPVIRGRSFNNADREHAPGVVIVSESVARRFWPGEDPIGKRIRTKQIPDDGGEPWRTVVGVVPDTHLRSLREPSPTVYFPWLQSTWQGYFAIRSSVPLPALLSSLRQAGLDVDPGVRLWHAQTMDELLAAPLAEPRVGTLLMSTFGLVALLLAAIGLYGVMTALVRGQTREIGVRMALGATSAVIRGGVLRRAMVVSCAGAAVGLGVALMTSRALTSVLFDVSPTDPVALGGACLILVVVGVVAACVPAWRATRIDPVRALRSD
jgi:putative ABC transport system permease protein